MEHIINYKQNLYIYKICKFCFGVFLPCQEIGRIFVSYISYVVRSISYGACCLRLLMNFNTRLIRILFFLTKLDIILGMRQICVLFLWGMFLLHLVINFVRLFKRQLLHRASMMFFLLFTLHICEFVGLIIPFTMSFTFFQIS